MAERLTKQELAERYPDQWLGLKNVKYKNDNGVTLESAEVAYTDKTEKELFMMQIKNTGVIAWYTTADDEITIGLAGVII